MEQLKGHLSEQLLSQLPNVKHHYIESEHPEHHWCFLQVKDEIVLDLGCGFHLIEPGWENTPEYFVNKGAKKVIGVEPATHDVNVLTASFPNHNFYVDSIDSSEKLEHYVNKNSVTSLKMDIEGYETVFVNSNDAFSTLKYVAIESHSREILNNVINKLISLNFTIDTVCTFYPRVYDVCNLVYAHRN